MKRSTIDIFQYTSYRTYLRAVFEDMKRTEKAFSFRTLQQRAGFSNRSNHFWQVINGTTKLSPAAAEKYATALGLTAKEKKQLRAMVAFEQAKNAEERELAITKMISSSEFLSGKKYHTLALAMFSEWLLPTIYDAVTLDTFRDDPDWITNALFVDTPKSMVAEALQKLTESGFIIKDEKGKSKQEPFNLNEYLPASKDTSIVLSTLRKKMIKKIMLLSLNALYNQPFDQRLFYSHTIAVSKDLYEEMKQRVITLQEDIQAIAQKSKTKDSVYLLNVQFFKSFDGSK